MYIIHFFSVKNTHSVRFLENFHLVTQERRNFKLYCKAYVSHTCCKLLNFTRKFNETKFLLKPSPRQRADHSFLEPIL